MSYKEINLLAGFKDLEQFGFNILEETLSDFLSCHVQLFLNPPLELKKHRINIFEFPKRGFYPIDENYVIVLGRILDDDLLISALGIKIRKPGIGKLGKLLTILEGSISHTLTAEYKNRFKRCKYLLGEELIIRTISNYFSIGGYDSRHIRHLIDFFNRLRTTSFEGQYFSTGLLLTRAHFEYNKKGTRLGQTYNLKKSYHLSNTNSIDRRFWYLADGKRSFYIGNKSLVLTQLFVLDHLYENSNFIDNHTLSKSLKGTDLLFKIENEKSFSVINSSNIEISFIENQWKLRDYNFIRSIFVEHFEEPELIDSLLYFVIYCSKNSISSIIWLPHNIDLIDDFIISTTKNKLIKKSIPINDRSFTNHIIRYLSSDGATVINKCGSIEYYGCIVDMGKATIAGVKGTGESAAGSLSQNGISIKISQDGTIKVFKENSSKPIVI